MREVALSDKKVFSFDNLYRNILNMEDVASEEQKPPQFRLSSSPFCPYKFIFDWATFLDEGSWWNFSGDFFTGCGTSIHSSLQKWIPRVNPGFILGNWRCLRCCKHPEYKECSHCTKDCNFYHQAKVGPKICHKCSRFMTYEEFNVIVSPCISGHCDGVLLYGDRVLKLIKDLEIKEDNTYILDNYLRKAKIPLDAYVLEYKSTTRFSANSITQPKLEHYAQASMYIVPVQQLLLHYGLKINILGSIVKYISRDLPNITSRDLYIPYENMDYYKYNVLMSKLVYRAVKDNDVSQIKLKKLPCAGRFKEFYCNCSYRDTCSELRKDFKEFFSITQPSIRKEFLSFKKTFGHLIIK